MDKNILERVAALSPEQRRLLDLMHQKIAPAPGHPAGQATETMTTAPPASSDPSSDERGGVSAEKNISFSLFFFSDDGAAKSNEKYRLLFECAKFADRHGFKAVWTPERHFMPFGGLYPNPSVVAAALAVMTERVKLRAGSVVLPLQDPIRVAEEWAVVDNISKGRIEVAFASGWHPDDFVLAPDRYENRREKMFQGIEKVKTLWKGGTLILRNGLGKEIEVRIFPNPIQDELPIWITATSRETFIRAGQIGAHVLTGLIEQRLEECAENIGLYRESLRKHGYDPQTGQVAVMLHTYIGREIEAVKEKVRQPFCNYLSSFIKMIEKNYLNNPGAEVEINQVTLTDRNALLNYAFERYFKTGSLLGTAETCQVMIDKLLAIGVDEVACLLDFGLESASIVEGLQYLADLKDRYQSSLMGSAQPALNEPRRAENRRFDRGLAYEV